MTLVIDSGYTNNNVYTPGKLTLAKDYTENIVTSGLMLRLDAGDVKSYPGSGTTWTDLSGQGNNGTLINGPIFSSNNGGSIVFNGVNANINLGNPGNLNILNFTVCVWSKSFTFTNYQNLIFKGANFAAQYGIIINASGQWAIQPNFDFISGDPLSLNTWNFLVGTYDGTKISAYRNGEQKTEYNISQSSIGNVITVGADTVNNRYLNGTIALTLIYNRALTAAEIQQNFNVMRGRFNI